VDGLSSGFLRHTATDAPMARQWQRDHKSMIRLRRFGEHPGVGFSCPQLHADGTGVARSSQVHDSSRTVPVFDTAIRISQDEGASAQQSARFRASALTVLIVVRGDH
jgi:hypothetical protein